MIPIGRETILGRFPWATVLLIFLNGLFFLGTWPWEMSFVSSRRNNSPIVIEAKALASLAMDGVSTLPADVRVRLEDLRANPLFPNQEADEVLDSIQNHFDYLNTFKRPDWDRHYAAYAEARKSLEIAKVPWNSIIGRYVFRSDDNPWPRMATYSWVHVGPLHLLLVLFFLWLAGSHMEEVWGFFATLLIYATGAGVSAAVVRYAFAGGQWALLGGTGGAAALLGALLSRNPVQPVRFFYILGITYGVVNLPAWISLVAWAPAMINIGWFTDNQMSGLQPILFHGTGLIWGVAVGALAGWRRKEAVSKQGEDPIILNRRVEEAKSLFKQGKAEEARTICQGVLEIDPTHMEALRELTAIYEFFQDEDAAARLAIRIIKMALERGHGRIAEETFRKWSLRLFQAKIPPQDRLVLGQNLETLQLWREALAYYRSVIEGSPGSSFAGKATFASAKIQNEQLRKSDEAAKLLRTLLDPPYDVEWRALAEAELRTIMKM